MTQPRVSILVPQYKTLELTTLCLRLLRKYTDPQLARVIVIDNDSQDDSLRYLKKLSWIQLIERPRVPEESPVMAHAKALDLGLSYVDTPYVLSIHTDTLVKRADWLDFLIAEMTKEPNIAGVGSWKLESKPLIKRILKYCERRWQAGYRYCIGQKDPGQNNYHYLRSHCALYRSDLIQQHALSFADGDAVAGKVIHKKLIDLGYQMVFLASETLGQYVDHINHATTLLNPEFKDTIRRHRDKALRHLEQRLRHLGSQQILAEDSLDH